MLQENRVRAPAMSFIVRVWADEGSGSEMRGEVELVRTGERRLFLNHLSLLSLIETWRRDLEAVR